MAQKLCFKSNHYIGSVLKLSIITLDLSKSVMDGIDGQGPETNRCD